MHAYSLEQIYRNPHKNTTCTSEWNSKKLFKFFRKAEKQDRHMKKREQTENSEMADFGRVDKKHKTQLYATYMKSQIKLTSNIVRSKTKDGK